MSAKTMVLDAKTIVAGVVITAALGLMCALVSAFLPASLERPSGPAYHVSMWDQVIGERGPEKVVFLSPTDRASQQWVDTRLPSELARAERGEIRLVLVDYPRDGVDEKIIASRRCGQSEEFINAVYLAKDGLLHRGECSFNGNILYSISLNARRLQQAYGIRTLPFFATAEH